MSRQIDITEPLSDEDKAYLVAFGSPDKVAQAEAIAADPDPGVVLPVDAEEARLASLAARPNTGNSSLSDEELRGAMPPAPVVVQDYTREDYESWKKADLQAEITDRNEGRTEDSTPPRIETDDQKNETLVDALVADDEALRALADEDADGDDEDESSD